MPVSSQDRIRLGTQSSVPVSFTPWSSTSSTYLLISKMGRRTRFRNNRHTGATTQIKTMFANHHKATTQYLHVGPVSDDVGIVCRPRRVAKECAEHRARPEGVPNIE